MRTASSWDDFNERVAPRRHTLQTFEPIIHWIFTCADLLSVWESVKLRCRIWRVLLSNLNQWSLLICPLVISSKISDELLRQRTEEDQIDLLSQAFEGDWKLGRDPSIKQFLEKYSQSLSASGKVELERQLQAVLSECQSTFPRPRDSSATIVGSTLSQERPPLFQFDLPYHFGEYVLKELVGTGGKSVVYRGTCEGSDESYAIKITPSAFITDRRSFERELIVVSQLDHPRIIKPNYSGTFREWSFVSSRYLSAPNLRDYLEANGPFTISQAIEIVASLAETLQYAHDRGVIHRDLKPRNVLLIDNHNSQDSNDEQPTEAFTPIVIDFGLAKDINSDSCATLTGTFFGTPAYTSPEQAKFDTRNTSNRSDIYSLGVILYELIGYSTPFQGSVESLLNQIAINEVPSVRKRNRLIDSSLTNIVHKCLRLDPNKRYAAAGDIATDLRRWLSAGQVDTKAYSKAERFKLGMRKLVRNRSLLAVVAVCLLAINVAIVSWIISNTSKTNKIENAIVIQSAEQFDKEIARATMPDLGRILIPNNKLLDECLDKIESRAKTASEKYQDSIQSLHLVSEDDAKSLAIDIAFLSNHARYDLFWKHLSPLADPRVETYLSEGASKVALPPSILIERLLVADNSGVQYSLLHTLGTYVIRGLPVKEEESLKQYVKKAYEQNGDAGVHAMCLRLWKYWNTDLQELSAIDKRLIDEGIVTNKNWYVTKSGMHMAIIRGPIQFNTGKLGTTGDLYFDGWKPRTLDYSFAISMEPVRFEHFKFYPQTKLPILKDTEPVRGVSWMDCAHYCDWLSQRDEIVSTELATADFENEHLLDIIDKRSGYRIPTTLEWELFARAYTFTDHYFGNMETLTNVGFLSLDHPLAVNSLGHCFTKYSEWSSTQPNSNAANLRTLNFKTTFYTKGGQVPSSLRIRELTTSPPDPSGKECVFRILRVLPNVFK